MSSKSQTAQFLSESKPQSAIVSYDHWLDQVGVTSTTGWRWRRKGWLVVTNICGRLYLTAEAIASFTRRATAGEFAKQHTVPKRKERR